jgi:hypothetical protein
VRVIVDAAVGVGDADRFEQLDRPLVAGLLASPQR